MSTRKEIEARIAFGELIIKGIANDPDPRRDAAIENLRRQIGVLQAELVALPPPFDGAVVCGSGPFDQVVGMKPLYLRSQIGGKNG